jgi:hypothetical protein
MRNFHWSCHVCCEFCTKPQVLENRVCYFSRMAGETQTPRGTLVYSPSVNLLSRQLKHKRTFEAARMTYHRPDLRFVEDNDRAYPLDEHTSLLFSKNYTHLLAILIAPLQTRASTSTLTPHVWAFLYAHWVLGGHESCFHSKLWESLITSLRNHPSFVNQQIRSCFILTIFHFPL